MQFSVFGREIPCKTTETRKVTVKPLIHTTVGTILLIVSLINIFGSDARKNRTCLTRVRAKHATDSAIRAPLNYELLSIANI